MSMVNDGTPTTPAVFRAGEQFDILRRNERTDEYDHVRVVVTGAGLPTVIPEGFSYVLYLSEAQAQELVERTRGGGSAADDAPFASFFLNPYPIISRSGTGFIETIRTEDDAR